LIGILGDFLFLFVGANVPSKMIPPEVLTDGRELADAAEMRRKEEKIEPPPSFLP